MDGAFSKILLMLSLILSLIAVASATEIESGYVQASSTGSMTEDIGFRPDYIEFVSSQQVETLNSEFRVDQNQNCPDNANGWSEGSVLFESTGNTQFDIRKQFTIGAFRNSDSTNDHRVASSTSDVIKNVYTGRNGGKCGELRISVERPTSTGFEVDIEDKFSQFDEIIRYKAYQFPDNMKFEAGLVEIDSEGSKRVNTGFSPANIHIRAGQQISSKNIDTQFGDNDPEEDNTLGRSKGYVTLDESGSVIDQQSIGTASSSDSTNAHRSIASDQYVLNTAYVGQDGNLFGRLRARVTGADSNGFDMQVDDKWSGTDDIFLYRAWGFSYYDFKIGYRSVSSEGSQSFKTWFTNWASGEPNDSGGDEECAEMYPSGEWNDIPCDDSSDYHEGVCEYSDGAYDTTSDTSFTDARSECQSRGGDLVVIDDLEENNYISNNYGNIWIGYKQNSGGQEPDRGWRWIGSSNPGFEPDAIDIYAEQQIDSINNEVVTPDNSGCDNAGGWSNGYYETDDDRQWSLSTGRSSDSQNAHRVGSSLNYALNNVYSNQGGGDCGNLQGQVTSTSSNGFQIDFNFDSNFDNRYNEEIIYYRALNFRTAPPTVESIEFQNLDSGHKFDLEANISEGSNDISSCTITADDGSFNTETYSGTASTINSTWSQCSYSSINFDDNNNWKDQHDFNSDLISLDVTVEASDVDGLSDSKTESHSFSNNRPEIVSIDFSDYSNEHAFDVSAVINDVDADNPHEIRSCQMNMTDSDGNKVTENVGLNYGYGDSDQAECLYSSVNSSMPYPSADQNGFQPNEEINVSVGIEDYHSATDSGWNTHVIPNRPPQVDSLISPADGSLVVDEPELRVDVSDPEGDPFNMSFVDFDTGDVIETVENAHLSGSHMTEWDSTLGEHEWFVNFTDPYDYSESSIWEFTRVIDTSYRLQQTLDYEYSALILSEQGTGNTFVEVTNPHPDDKEILTELESENGYFNAYFLQTGTNSTSYTIQQGDTKTLQIQVNAESVQQSRNDKLIIKHTDQNVGAVNTKELDILVRSSEAEFRDAPGLTGIYLLFIGLAASGLFALSVW